MNVELAKQMQEHQITVEIRETFPDDDGLIYVANVLLDGKPFYVIDNDSTGLSFGCHPHKDRDKGLTNMEWHEIQQSLDVACGHYHNPELDFDGTLGRHTFETLTHVKCLAAIKGKKATLTRTSL